MRLQILHWPRRAGALLSLSAMVLLAACLLGPALVAAEITQLGIDFGSQFIKVSCVTPGSNPLQTVFSKMSERKFPNAIAFAQSGPVFGSQALQRSLTRPEQGYSWLNMVLGRKFEDEHVQDVLRHTVVARERDEATGFASLKAEDGAAVPVHYLIALTLRNIVEETEATTSRIVKGVVITVPPYFSQTQRQAILDAARIAEVSVLGLVHDISAAALNYGVFYASKTRGPQNIIFFDSGSTHSSAALVTINPNHEENGKSAAFVEVKRVVTDLNLSGLALDRIVAGVLAEKFANSNDGAEIPMGRAYNRLMKEASRVKHVLSGNKEANGTVEDIVGAQTLNADITREEFLEKASHLRSAASSLVERLLKEEGLTSQGFDLLIPVGGNSRVPFVREDLSNVFGERVQSLLNMEESIAHGAGWYAAMQANYRIRPTHFVDSFPFPISLEYSADGNTEAVNNIIVYGAPCHTRGHKGISLKGISSIAGRVLVGDGDPASAISVAVDEVQKVLESYKSDDRVRSHKIKFWIDLNSSGLVEVKATPVALVEVENPAPPKAVTNSTEAANTTDPSTTEPASPEPKTIMVTESHPLAIKVQVLYPRLADKEASWCVEKLRALKRAELEAAQKSAARNNLESAFYRLKDLLELEEFVKFAGSDDLKNFERQFEIIQSTIDADEATQTTEQYEGILKDTLSIEKTVRLREAAYLERAAASSELASRAQSVHAYVELMRTTEPNEAARGPSDADLEALHNEALAAISWHQVIETEQSKRDSRLDPAVPAAQIRERIVRLNTLFHSISSKKAPERQSNATAPATDGQEASATQPSDAHPASHSEPAQDTIPKEGEEERMEL